MADSDAELPIQATVDAELSSAAESSTAVVHSPAGGQAVPRAAHPAIERLLLHEEHAQKAAAGSTEPRASVRSPALGLGVGTVLAVTARSALVAMEAGEHEATLGAHVDPEFLELAMQRGEPVLLHRQAGGP